MSTTTELRQGIREHFGQFSLHIAAYSDARDRLMD
jgi:hypothetical protein